MHTNSIINFYNCFNFNRKLFISYLSMLFLRKLYCLEAGQFAQISLKYIALQWLFKCQISRSLVTEDFQRSFQNDILTREIVLWALMKKGCRLKAEYTLWMASRLFSVSTYKLANSGLFKTIHIDNMIRISSRSFEDWITKLNKW